MTADLTWLEAWTPEEGAQRATVLFEDWFALFEGFSGMVLRAIWNCILTSSMKLTLQRQKQPVKKLTTEEHVNETAIN